MCLHDVLPGRTLRSNTNPKFFNHPLNFAFQAFLKVRRLIKWINTFCGKNSVRFVRMRRLKDLDMSLKTLDHCTGLWFSALFSLLRLAKQMNANSTLV
jgi:hypothetical protein